MIGIIIQARMGSTRLPGKVLKKIDDQTIIQYIITRLSKLNHEVIIIVATTKLAQDDVIEKLCINNQLKCFRGSENNVLERYYQCSKYYHFEHIIRLTADNPLTDIDELDQLIDLHISSNADYSHSVDTLPKGIGAEIFTFSCLEACYKKSDTNEQKEHVNEYIYDNPDQFKIQSLNVPDKKNRPDLSFTVDTPSDFERISSIIKHAQKNFITTVDAIRLCSQSV